MQDSATDETAYTPTSNPIWFLHPPGTREYIVMQYHFYCLDNDDN